MTWGLKEEEVNVKQAAEKCGRAESVEGARQGRGGSDAVEGVRALKE